MSRRLSRVWICAYLFVFLASFTASIRGQGSPNCNVTLTAKPNSIVDGCGTDLTCDTGNDPNCNPINYSWEYTCQLDLTTCPNQPLGGNPPNAPKASIQFPIPGSYTMACRVDWRPPYYGAPAPRQSVAACQVDVAPPNGQRITAGLNNPTPADGSPDVVQFQITSVGKDCCPYAAGWAEEIITRNGESTTGPQNADFYYSEGIIYDNKRFRPQSFNDLTGFLALPDGTVLDDFFQQNNFKYNDCCGNTVTVNLGTYHFQRQKSGTGWILVQL